METPSQKAVRIELFRFDTPSMRAFHLSWLAFFSCFFAWFGIAPLMKLVRDDLQLTQEQVGHSIIAGVAATVLARLLIGRLCDTLGPRRTYTWLLLLGSLPVMGVGLAWNFESFIVFRLLIGLIGGAFVITQYHTSVMFAPNCVGTANATTAGWGNLGGGVTQAAMPLIFAGIVALGATPAAGWRWSMVVAGGLCMLLGLVYYRFTQDCPEGNYRELRAAGKMPPKKQSKGSFLAACRDVRVWALFTAYAACFGIELTIKNVAALYFVDYFDEFKQMTATEALRWAGALAALYGGMNIFSRTLGGIASDRLAVRRQLSGRAAWLFVTLFCEGLALLWFSQARSIYAAVPALLTVALFVQMAAGATYAIVPFIHTRALGSVAGIVGAGGNLGAVAAGLLFTGLVSWPQALLILGVAVLGCSFVTFLIRAVPHAAEMPASETRGAAAAAEPAYGAS
jgi:NNP family nitrate/nitrite transporter-like MFS transporter